jgi:DNA (cytosine-5)-methyltransferase 1
MHKTYTRKIGQNRGKPRLWLEGAILLDSGFKHQATWDVVRVSDVELLLRVSTKGSRRIAGTQEMPIIDINSGDILDGFSGHSVTIKSVSRGNLRVVKNEGGQP